MSNCLTDAQLAAFAENGDDAAAAVHVDQCATCQQALAAIRADDGFLQELRGAVRPQTHFPQVAGYDIRKEISSGGQGVVYRALERSTQREVALKVLRTPSPASASQRRRFEREIEAIGQLRHPHIVTLYGATQTASGVPAFAMEFIDGVPLDEYVQRIVLAQDAAPKSRTDVIKIVELLVTVAGAVGHAHQRGVMHRDLKPGNILVDSSGSPHVLDFGLGALLQADADRLTLTQEFAGTLDYAAPEQVSAQNAGPDVRTDVYALGLVLYRLLTGAAPYSITGALSERLDAIIHRNPTSPTRANEILDDEISSILMRALAKSPDERYASANEFAADLENYIAGRPVAAKSHSNWYQLRVLGRRYRWPVAIGVVTLAASVVLAIAMTALYRNARNAKVNADAALRDSRIERARLLSATGDIARAEDLLWAQYQSTADTDATLDPAHWALLELYLQHPCLRTWRLELPFRYALIDANAPVPLLAAITLDGDLVELPIDNNTSGVIHRSVAPANARVLPAATRKEFLVQRRAESRWIDMKGEPVSAVSNLNLESDCATVISPAGTRMLAPQSDGSWSLVSLAESPTTAQHRQIFAADEAIQRALFLDETEILTKANSGVVTRWHVGTDGIRKVWQRQDGHADGEPWLVGEPDPESTLVLFEQAPGGHVAIVDRNDGRLLHDLNGAQYPKFIFADAGPENESLAFATINDSWISVVDLPGTQPMLHLYGHRSPAHWVQWLSDSRLLSISRDCEIKLWAVPTRDPALRRWQLDGGVLAVAWRDDETVLATPANDGLVRLSLADSEIEHIAQFRESVASGVTPFPRDEIAIANHDGVVEVYQRGGRTPTRSHNVVAGRIRSLVRMPNTTELALAGDDGRLHLLEIETGEVRQTQPQRDRCSVVAVSPDGNFVATGNQVGDFVVYDAKSLAELSSRNDAKFCLRAIAFSPDGSVVATAGDDAMIRLYDTSNWSMAPREIETSNTNYGLSFRPDGLVLATGDSAGTIQFWDIATGRNLMKLPAHNGPAYAVAYSPDGLKVASGGEDGAVRVYDFSLPTQCIRGNDQDPSESEESTSNGK